MPCTIWPPPEPLSSSLAYSAFPIISQAGSSRRALALAVPSAGSTLPQSGAQLIPSLHFGLGLNLTSARLPDDSIPSGAALHLPPYTASFLPAFITTQLYITYPLPIFPLVEYQFYERKDLVCFAHRCASSS